MDSETFVRAGRQIPAFAGKTHWDRTAAASGIVGANVAVEMVHGETDDFL
jgi:hypothetical protein